MSDIDHGDAKTRTRRPQDHPARRRMGLGKKWSWHEASKALNVSARYLRLNMHRLPPEHVAKLEEHILGD